MTFDNSGSSKDEKLNTLTKTNGYDSSAPPNLVNFMLKSWKSPSGKPLKPIKNLNVFNNRREVLSAAFPGECLVIPSGRLKVRSNDCHYPFRPSSDFFYLTGCVEPECALVLVPDGKGHKPVFFAEANRGKVDAGFFTDRVRGELWTGKRPTLEDFRNLFGIADARPYDELPNFLKAFSSSCRLLRTFDDSVIKSTSLPQDLELATFLSEMRLIKDKVEVKELEAAIDSTKTGFEDVIRRMKTAKTERELEGVFFTRARMEGNDVGYASIVASGSHACTLHWNRNTGDLNKGDLLLLDAGVEGNSLYTADITRTLPIKGKFTREQRDIYELVLAAQLAAIKEVKPGLDFMAPNRAAMQVLAEGLERLKILPTTAQEALKEENQFYKRYSLHNVSHMLGLDVHDCAQARAENYKHGALRPGMVLTVEPGLYFQTDDQTVPAKYRGIGVRIEDDVLVTEKGVRVLSDSIPKEVAEIERWIAKLWKSA